MDAMRDINLKSATSNIFQAKLGLVRRHTKLQMYTHHCSAGFISCGSISRPLNIRSVEEPAGTGDRLAAWLLF